MSIFVWIIFGLLVGLIANIIDPRPSKGGIFGAVILGIAGALLGGFLSSLFFNIGITGFDTRSFIVAIIGSVMLLFIGRSFQREI